MDHAVDLIGNGLCGFIIVPSVVSIDRDIHTAKVGRPGRTASGQSCLWEVSARAIEMWQGQFRQTERADAVVRKPSGSMQGKRKMSGGKSAHSFYPAPGIYYSRHQLTGLYKWQRLNLNFFFSINLFQLIFPMIDNWFLICFFKIFVYATFQIFYAFNPDTP